MEENISDSRVKWIKENLYNKKGDFNITIENDKVIIHGSLMIPGVYSCLLYKIDEVYGDVIIDNINEPIEEGNIESLKNFPTIIHGNFICKLNKKLKSFKDGPERVEGNFICVGCGIKDISSLPKYIGGNCDIYCNEITDLAPIFNSNIVGLIDVQFNPCESSKEYMKLLKERKISIV